MVTDPLGGRSAKYLAAPGELNRVTLTGNPDGSVVLAGEAGIQPGSGCSAVDRTRVRCQVDLPTGSVETLDGPDVVRATVSSQVDGGAGDDRIATSPGGLGFGGALAGGPGDDVLSGGGRFVGGPGNDLMTGATGSDFFDESEAGNGSDTITGRGGPDIVDYGGRRGPVRADLQGDRDDGEAGENDQLGADLYGIVGGPGHDVLVGNAAANLLIGNGGGDTLAGGSGADRLFGSTERGRGGDGPNKLLPGPGQDIVSGGGGADRVSARDRSSDRVRCLGGSDRVRADRLDFFRSTCERIRRRGPASAVPLEVFSSTDRDEPEVTFVEVGCPADGPRRCVGTVSVVHEGRRLAARPFAARRGRIASVAFRRLRLGDEPDPRVRVIARSRDRKGRVRTVAVSTYVDGFG